MGCKKLIFFVMVFQFLMSLAKMETRSQMKPFWITFERCVLFDVFLNLFSSLTSLWTLYETISERNKKI